MDTPIVAFYAGLLSVVYLYLTIIVILNRREKKIGLGDGGDRHFLQIVRVHGNFSEYVPLILVLFLIAEINQANQIMLHICGVAILFGRLIHAYGLRRHFGSSWQRVTGGGLTILTLLLLAVMNLLVLY